MTVGWSIRGYPTTRCVVDKVPGVEYVHSCSYAAAISQFARMMRIPARGIVKYGCSFIGGTQSRKVDLYHFFNQISVGLCRKPFVTTFETALPRGLRVGDYWWSKSIEALTSLRCKRLIALSECAREIQMHTEGVPDLSDRLIVLHPPQEVLIDSEALRRKENHQGKLKFLFVGRDFFHKGGGEILRAFIRLRAVADMELILVGDLSRHDYLDLPGVDDTGKHMEIIKSHENWIHHYRYLPNIHVLELMKNCDVGLLPTRADTYGYSVLEMQACGLPVITTDVRALPEINNDKCGWLIKGCGVRDGSTRYGEADCSTREKKKELSERIENGVYNACVEIAAHPELIAEKRTSALARIKEEHDPVQYGLRLGEIYKEAIG